VIAPRPAALRLSTRARDARAPAPPLGVSAWSDEADAVAVLLDGAEADLDDASAVADQLPAASTLPPRTLVVVLGTPARAGGVLRRWLPARTAPVPRSARCTALLARGYVDVGAEAGVAWGWSPGSPPST
jgi:hypothetical protein